MAHVQSACSKNSFGLAFNHEGAWNGPCPEHTFMQKARLTPVQLRLWPGGGGAAPALRLEVCGHAGLAWAEQGQEHPQVLGTRSQYAPLEKGGRQFMAALCRWLAVPHTPLLCFSCLQLMTCQFAADFFLLSNFCYSFLLFYCLTLAVRAF